MFLNIQLSKNLYTVFLISIYINYSFKFFNIIHYYLNITVLFLYLYIYHNILLLQQTSYITTVWNNLSSNVFSYIFLIFLILLYFVYMVYIDIINNNNYNNNKIKNSLLMIKTS